MYTHVFVYMFVYGHVALRHSKLTSTPRATGLVDVVVWSSVYAAILILGESYVRVFPAFATVDLRY